MARRRPRRRVDLGHGAEHRAFARLVARFGGLLEGASRGQFALADEYAALSDSDLRALAEFGLKDPERRGCARQVIQQLDLAETTHSDTTNR